MFNLLIILFLGYLPTYSNTDSIQVSLLTVGPGKTIESIYGHNAIRIKDDTKNIDLTFNYGTFDFDTPGFIIKFMRGKLPYIVGASRYENFLNYYYRENRNVTEQVLNLDSLQKVEIIEFLEWNILPENKEYMYDFFMDNCATRLRDILEQNIASLQWDTTRESQKTFRQIIKGYQTEMPWTDFGIDLIIGARAERKTNLREETFIPDYLMNAVSYAKTNNQKGIEQSKNVVLNIEQTQVKPNFLLTPMFLFIILFLFEVNLFFRGLNQKTPRWTPKYDAFWIIIVTICSILMVFMWWGTDHSATKDNWNLLWATPLLLVWYFTHIKESLFSNTLLFLISVGLLLSLINSIPALNFLPQYFHPVISVICMILALKIGRLYLQTKKINNIPL